jgi:hypothetical protein
VFLVTNLLGTVLYVFGTFDNSLNIDKKHVVLSHGEIYEVLVIPAKCYRKYGCMFSKTKRIKFINLYSGNIEMDIHRITMEIMGNPQVIKRTDSSNVLTCLYEDESDFYRERIIELTEELLKRDMDFKSRIWKDVSTSFNYYVDNCIKYFKMIDTTDLLQSEYNELCSVKTEEEKEKEAMEQLELLGLDNISYDNANKAIMRNVKCDMTNFIKRTKSQKPSFYFPKKKEINLQCDSLKKKSIHSAINVPLVVNENENCELIGENTYVVINDLNTIVNNDKISVNEFDDIFSSSSIPPYVGHTIEVECNKKEDPISLETTSNVNYINVKNIDDSNKSIETITEEINENIIPIEVVEDIVMGLVHDNMLQNLQELKDKEEPSDSTIVSETLEISKENIIFPQKSGKKKNKGKGKKKKGEETISSSLQVDI